MWTRWLVLALGAGTHAATLVLAVFMGGLGAGAFAAGRLAVLALAPPTILMGATLPLLSRWAVDRGFLPARGDGGRRGGSVRP